MFNLIRKSLTRAAYKIISSSSAFSSRMSPSDLLDADKGIVYACSSVIAEKISDIELNAEVRTGDKWELDKNNLLVEAIQHPSQDLSMAQLYYLTSKHLTLLGDAFWYMVRDERGELMEIIPLTPTEVMINKGPMNKVISYRYTGGNAPPKVIEAADVIHYRILDPRDYNRGVGVAEALNEVLTLEAESAKAQYASILNMNRPSGILRTKRRLNQDQIDLISSEWNREYKGTTNINKTAILGDDFDFKPIGTSLEDLQMINTRNFNIKQIMAAFRVSNSILGIEASSTRATAETAVFSFSNNVIRPQMKILIDALNNWIYYYYDANLRINFTDPVPPDKAFELESAERSTKTAIKSINEARELLGLPPTAHGDEILIDLNKIPLSEAFALFEQRFAVPTSNTNDNPGNEPEIEDENEEDETDE